MDRLLVTGEQALLVQTLFVIGVKKYPEDSICILDELTYAGNKQSLREQLKQPSCNFVHGSICDQLLVERIFNENQINKVVHFAAESHVDRSIEDPDAFIKTNIVGTHILLRVASRHWLEKKITDHLFHHVSTDEVYGSLSSVEPAFDESSRYAPNSPYTLQGCF